MGIQLFTIQKKLFEQKDIQFVYVFYLLSSNTVYYVGNKNKITNKVIFYILFIACDSIAISNLFVIYKTCVLLRTDQM